MQRARENKLGGVKLKSLSRQAPSASSKEDSSNSDVDVVGLDDEDLNANKQESQIYSCMEGQLIAASSVSSLGNRSFAYSEDIIDLTSDSEDIDLNHGHSGYTCSNNQADIIEIDSDSDGPDHYANITNNEYSQYSNSKDTVKTESCTEWIPCLNTLDHNELMILSTCIEAWEPAINWEAQSNHNPLWDVLHSPLMASPESLAQLLTQQSMIWTHNLAPQIILIPIVDHKAMHCYLWYGKVIHNSILNKLDLSLQLLDLLPNPGSSKFNCQFVFVKKLVNYMLPHINGSIKGSLMDLPYYCQRPGSADCGYFVCQAVLALTMNHERALDDLIGITEIKGQVFQILQDCKDGALQNLSDGYIPHSSIVLHKSSTIAPPPWLGTLDQTANNHSDPNSKKKQTWNVPQIVRSLSEPSEDIPPEGLSGGWNKVFGEQMERRFATLSDTSRNALWCGWSAPPKFDEGPPLEDDNTEEVSWLPGDHVQLDLDSDSLEEPNNSLAVPRFLKSLPYLGSEDDQNKALLTGCHKRRPLRLNWARDPLPIEPESLTAGLTVDSLSLTVKSPQFTSNISLHVTKLSHIPNFTWGHVGSANPFRINVFFPNYEKGKNAGGRYITMLNAQDCSLWYTEVVRQAIMQAEMRCAPQLRHAVTSLQQELPVTYSNAESLVNGGSQGRLHREYPVCHEVFNIIALLAREIVENTRRLAKFKGFFFHIWGSGLKSLGHQIPNERGSALLCIFKEYPFVDWSLQNPQDIVVDIGLEINIKQEELSLDTNNLTLLWKLSVLKQLIWPAWRKGHVNSYMHSRVVAGLSAAPRSLISHSFYYSHAYMKDKVVTYRHCDSSIGIGFSPKDGLNNTDQYNNEIAKLTKGWTQSTGCYGVQLEWRCGIWASEQILRLDPSLWVQRFLMKGAILAFKTHHVVQLKVTFLRAYDYFFCRVQVLPAPQRRSEEVLLLAAVLHYLMHGLVKRPDEMSSSCYMAKGLGILSRAMSYGFASFTEYKILQYSACHTPAGACLKPTLSLSKTDQFIIRALENMQQKNAAKRVMHTGKKLIQKSNNPTTPSNSAPRQLTTETEDFVFFDHLINEDLSGWLWSKFPIQDQTEAPNLRSFEGPFQLKLWKNSVGPGVKCKSRISRAGFQNVISQLFPDDWVMKDRGQMWDSYQAVVLDPIIKRLEQEDKANRATRASG
ncbi:capsular polysaccharide export protein [Rhizoctonia solani]|uniref:Capsular polysaccharide export protein n=1 Tax=Rhizoctonia solani TaxID=456999 RepID=A0A8H8NMQ9_9AGAM|nr:capsular polysaccharide export protein [Rhizoctonia solani]QRW16636.1 capsular polysaccharide export protein [Rhizoctonia solani]